jgi:hypothetical protein
MVGLSELTVEKMFFHTLPSGFPRAGTGEAFYANLSLHALKSGLVIGQGQ